MDSKIAKRVTDILVIKMGLSESEITPDANFTKDLGIDSLDFAELTMEFEQEFDIKINDSDTEGIHTFSEAVTFIGSRVAEKK